MLAIKERIAHLENLDASLEFKHIPRKKWPKNTDKDNVILWQIPQTTAKLLAKLVSYYQPRTILELGTSGGYSALWMLQACETSHVHTIEFSRYRFDIAKESFEQTGLTHRVTQYNDKISVVLNKWKLPVDFVFIDAAKKHYLDNFKKIKPFLTKNAVIVVDNMLDDRSKTDSMLHYARKYYSCDLLPYTNGLLIITLNPLYGQAT